MELFAPIVTAPWQSIDPRMTESAPTVAAEVTRKLPTTKAFAPIVTAVPTSQNTFLSCAPLIRVMLTEAAISNAESVRKINLEFGSPPPSRTRPMVTPRAVPAGAA